MCHSPNYLSQRGAVLVISMLFLLVVTVISVVAARNSNFSLQMSSNMQDSTSSFQSAEAGVLATLLLSRTTVDPFNGTSSTDPFVSFTTETHPLRQLNDDPAALDVDVYFTGSALTCPRNAEGFTDGLLDCDYYRIESQHEVAKRSRTKVDMGVIKTTIGSVSR
jgi:hypothetical protein